MPVPLDLENIQENIYSYIALALAGERSFEEVSRLLKSYYLGIAEGKEIDQLGEVLALFSDANHFIMSEGDVKPRRLFTANLEYNQQAKEHISKVAVLNVRKL